MDECKPLVRPRREGVVHPGGAQHLHGAGEHLGRQYAPQVRVHHVVQQGATATGHGEVRVGQSGRLCDEVRVRQ